MLAEAVLSGVSCVATDVGEAKRIIGDEGKLVPRRNPQAIAQAWKNLIDLPEAERRSLAECARQRVASEFSLEKHSREFQELLQTHLCVE